MQYDTPTRQWYVIDIEFKNQIPRRVSPQRGGGGMRSEAQLNINTKM